MRFLLGFMLLPWLWAGLWAAGRDIVVVDTDSGLFGDDGAAVVMLLRSPSQVTVEGITLVPGNVWPAQGADYMFHILDLLKRPQPAVYTGADTPLLHTAAMAREAERRWGALAFTGAFADDPAAVKPAPGAKLTGRKAHRDAAAFLISEIQRHAGEVSLPREGDVILFRFGRCFSHGGIVSRVNPLTIIHAFAPARVVLEEEVERSGELAERLGHVKFASFWG